MLRSKIAYAGIVGIIAAAAFIGQAFCQDSRPADSSRRGRDRDPEQMRQRIEQYRQQMKTQLGVTDDEWKVLQPKIEKVAMMSRDARGGMFSRMFSGRGGRDRGGDRSADRGDRGSDNPDRPQSDIQKKQDELQRILKNKDAKPEDIKPALAAYREARAKAKEELQKAQKDLQEILTFRQEAVLVEMGILE